MIEYPLIDIPLIPFEPFIAVRQHRHGCLDGIHHPVRQPYILIILRLGQKSHQSPCVAEPIWSKYRVYRKALIGFIIPKHVVLEEIVRLFDLFAWIALIVDKPDPCADARQRPYIKLYSGLGETVQHPDMQSCRRSTTSQRNCSLHLNLLYAPNRVAAMPADSSNVISLITASISVRSLTQLGRPRARPKKVGCIFGRRRSISAVPDWR